MNFKTATHLSVSSASRKALENQVTEQCISVRECLEPPQGKAPKQNYKVLRSMGHLGGSGVERLPLAQVMILGTWDRVPCQASCMEPASPSACVSASLSVSLMNK